MSATAARRRPLRSLYRRAAELDRHQLTALAQAGLLLAAAWLALKLVSAQRVVTWKQRPGPARPVSSPEGSIARVRWAILAASRYAPAAFVCFPQCLAAAEMLRRQGLSTRLYYGAARVDGKLVTHTWLECAGKIVIGGEAAGSFSTLAVY